MDIFKEIFTAMNSRIRSPIFGSIALVFCSINWKSVFFVVFSGELAENRFSFFDANTSFWTLFVIPIGLGLTLAWAAPWISFFGAKLARVPVDYKKRLEITAEHELILEKTKLETVRHDLLETKEKSLIDQATRDEEISKIEDANIRDNLQTQIDVLRKGSETNTSDDLSNLTGVDYEIELLNRKVKNLKALADHCNTIEDSVGYDNAQRSIRNAYEKLDSYLDS